MLTVLSPSLPTIDGRVCYSQPITDGRAVNLAWIKIGLKGISRVMSMFVFPALGPG